MAEMTPLRRRMIEDMSIRNLSPVTQRCYLHAVTSFSRHFSCSPDRLGLTEVRAYQVHLVSTGASWQAFNQTVCALRFFYGVTLSRPAMVERIPYARKRQLLPVVLSADEIARFLAAVPNLKHRMALTTAYAAGLRVSEVVRLKIVDIDSSRMLIRVDQGKGGKDRYVMLSTHLLTMLRSYWEKARPRHWLFPGQNQRPERAASHLSRGAHCGRVPQAGDGAHAAPQLRHASAGSRHGHPYHPGTAWPSRPVDHLTLCAGRQHHDRQYAKPVRPAEAGESGVGLSRRGASPGSGGGVPPPR
jgi:integrase